MINANEKGGTKARVGPRILGAVVVIVPLVIVGAYRLGSRAARVDDGPAVAAEDQQDERAAATSRRTTWRPPAPSEVEPVAAPSLSAEPIDRELSPKEHRDQSVAEMRASGPDRHNLVPSAERVVKGWSEKVAKVGVEAEFGKYECYQKGCFVNVVLKSEADVDREMQAITRTGEFHGWRSGKMRSGSIARADGKVEVTWFLFPPQDGKEALVATLPADNLDELTRNQPSQ